MQPTLFIKIPTRKTIILLYQPNPKPAPPQTADNPPPKSPPAHYPSPAAAYSGGHFAPHSAPLHHNATRANRRWRPSPSTLAPISWLMTARWTGGP
ncbi:MAG: hypothetical protein MI864_14100 [Pseudomonadales bacterium]|nr:hypothetical protein [Pseudomonadales bacterium]